MRRSTHAAALAALTILPTACDHQEPVVPEPVAPPAIESLEPSEVEQGIGAFALTVRGQRFDAGSRVLVGDSAVETTFASAVELRAAVPAWASTTEGSLPIRVRSRDGLESEPSPLTVLAAPDPPGPEPATLSAGVINAGGTTTCAVTEAGEVLCWGRHGWTDDFSRPRPVALPGGMSRVYVESEDGAYACALDEIGAAWCWGRNRYGQLGRGQASDHHRDLPPAPVAGDHRFRSLDLSEGHVCGATVAGEVVCWGDNRHGQVDGAGGAAVGVPRAVAVPDSVVQVAAARQASCALATAELYCWGKEVWYDETIHPPTALKPPARFASIRGFGSDTCGTVAPSRLICWYSMGHPLRLLAYERLDGFRSMVLGMGPWEGCGIRPSGTAECWGSNYRGRRGTGADSPIATRDPLPVASAELFAALAVGDDHGCGVTRDGHARCWGYDGQGARGTGEGRIRWRPETAAAGRRFVWLRAGGGTVCGAGADGLVHCWGTALGSRSGAEAELAVDPEPVPGTENLRHPVVVDGGFCGLAADGQARCVGRFEAMGSDPIGFDTLVAGDDHVCGLTPDRKAWCWGVGDLGQLGQGAFEDSSAPVAVVGGHRFAMLVGGSRHTCGIDDDGLAWCWGSDAVSQLGAYTNRVCDTWRCSAEPLPVVGAHRWKAMWAGASFTCALRLDDTFWCWGGTFDPPSCTHEAHCSDVPTPLAPGPPLRALSPGYGTICGLDADGRGWCWGAPWVGDEVAGVERAEAVLLDEGANRWREVVHTNSGSCGLTTQGEVRCWGSPHDGLFGIGWQPVAWTPEPVAGDHRFRREAAPIR